MFQYNNDYPKNYGGTKSDNLRNSRFDQFDSISYDENDNGSYGGGDTQNNIDAYDNPFQTGPNDRLDIINNGLISVDQKNIPTIMPIKDYDYEDYDWNRISDNNYDTAATGSIDRGYHHSYKIQPSLVNEAAIEDGRKDESNDWRKISSDNIINTVQNPYTNRIDNNYVPSFSRSGTKNQPRMSTNGNKNKRNDWNKMPNRNIHKTHSSANSIPNNHYSGYNDRNYETQSTNNRMSFEDDNRLEISYDTKDTQNGDYDIIDDDDYNNYDWRQISTDDLASDQTSSLEYQQFDNDPSNNIYGKKLVPSTGINPPGGSDTDGYDRIQTEEDNTVNDINPILPKAKDTKGNSKYDEFDAIPMHEDMDVKIYNEKTSPKGGQKPLSISNIKFNSPSKKRAPFYKTNHVPTVRGEVQRNIPKKTNQGWLPQKGSNLC